MNAHDVRRLRVCDVCSGLLDKSAVIEGYGAKLCGACAIKRAGGLGAFMTMYPQSEWKKLDLATVGATGMQMLLRRIKGE